MMPQRWRRIEEIYHAALEQNGDARARFLSQECASDEALKKSVEELLAQNSEGASIFNHKLWNPDPSLQTLDPIAENQQFGAYRLISPIGAGGMGAVFLAEDTRLGRKVAIKISRDPYNKRFEREARAIASLNHPSICTLYDIGPNYLVMELLEGETLAARIDRGKLSAGEVLSYGRQIAEALAEAHSKGIVHRDLKPSNIMLTRTGVKVLDFGLAKLSEGDGKKLTESHVVMGTPAYMAPEQFRGEQAGPAADMFALGLVLYEMTEGKLPVGGSLGSAQAHGASVKIPGFSRAELPNLHPLITRLLEAEPGRRPVSAVEVRDALANPGQNRSPVRRRVTLAIAAGVLAAALLAAGWKWAGTSTRPMEVVQLAKVTSFPGAERDPALSPDGRLVAFVWNGESGKNADIYVMPVGASAPIRLTQDPGEDISPEWSPDGLQIAFVRTSTSSPARIMVIPAGGGQERVVREFRLPEDIRRAMRPLLAWTPDGRELIYTGQDEAARVSLNVTDLSGTATRRLFNSEEGSAGQASPAISRDGKWLAYTVVYGPGTSRLFARRLAPGLRMSTPPVAVSETGSPFVSSPVWGPDSHHLLFLQGRSIFEWEEGVKPRSIFTGSNRAAGMSAVWQPGQLLRIVFGDSTDHTELRIMPLHPGGLDPAGDAVAFADTTANQTHPQFSPDGRQVSFISTRSGATEVWSADSDGRNLRQLTNTNAAHMGFPRWSPDGKELAFHTWVGFHPQIFLIDLGGPAPATRRITDTPIGFFSPSWSADGKFLYVNTPTGAQRCFRVPADGGPPEDLFDGSTAMVTADGKKILYSKLGHLGIFERNLEGDITANPEDRLVEDYRPPAADLNVVSDGFYYIGTDPAGQPRAIRFYSYAQKKAVDVAVLVGARAGFSSGLAIAPDRRHLLFEQFAGSGTDITLLELR